MRLYTTVSSFNVLNFVTTCFNSHLVSRTYQVYATVKGQIWAFFSVTAHILKCGLNRKPVEGTPLHLPWFDVVLQTVPHMNSCPSYSKASVYFPFPTFLQS